MRITVNFDLCEANAYCVNECPDVFRLEEDDTLTVLTETPGEEMRGKALAAERRCPRAAIKVTE